MADMRRRQQYLIWDLMNSKVINLTHPLGYRSSLYNLPSTSSANNNSTFCRITGQDTRRTRPVHVHLLRDAAAPTAALTVFSSSPTLSHRQWARNPSPTCHRPAPAPWTASLFIAVSMELSCCYRGRVEIIVFRTSDPERNGQGRARFIAAGLSCTVAFPPSRYLHYSPRAVVAAVEWESGGGAQRGAAPLPNC
jgi:hypothetical protein